MMTMTAVGKTQRRILLLLEAGAALALSGSPRQFFRVLDAAHREWRRIEEAALRDSIRRLYQSRLIDARDHRDGSTTVVLTGAGKKKVLTYKIDEMKIKRPARWDGKWRVILFDVPERHRKIRDALRSHLRQLGCRELQKSVFVHPFECGEEIDFLIEFYQARPFVRFIVADQIDTALHLRAKFRI